MIGLNFVAQFVYWYRDIKPLEDADTKKTTNSQADITTKDCSYQGYLRQLGASDSTIRQQSLNYKQEIEFEHKISNIQDNNTSLQETPKTVPEEKDGNKPYSCNKWTSDDTKTSDVADGHYSFNDPYICTNWTTEDTKRKQAWENYEMDYTGRDSFDNVLAKLQKTLSEDQYHPHTHQPFNSGKSIK